MGTEQFMRRAISLSQQNIGSPDGGPFGAVVVKQDRIVGEGTNRVTGTNDPTAHAEMVAIRSAANTLGTFRLEGCEIYTSCEPCPMCLAAIYWARLDRVWYGNTRDDAAAIGFDDEFLYRELALPVTGRSLEMKQLLRVEAKDAFQNWYTHPHRVPY